MKNIIKELFDFDLSHFTFEDEIDTIKTNIMSFLLQKINDEFGRYSEGSRQHEIKRLREKNKKMRRKISRKKNKLKRIKTHLHRARKLIGQLRSISHQECDNKCKDKLREKDEIIRLLTEELEKLKQTVYSVVTETILNLTAVYEFV